MTVNDIKKLAANSSFQVFKIRKNQDATYSVIKFTPNEYMYWHEQEGLCKTHKDAELLCFALKETNSYPVMLDNQTLNERDIKEISKYFTVYREASKDNGKSVFEKFSLETKQWEYAFTTKDVFEYVDFIKKVNNTPDALVSQYIEKTNEYGIVID